MSLSNKIIDVGLGHKGYVADDVKEAVKELKEKFDYTFWATFDYDNCLILQGKFDKEIDKIFGEKLI